MFLFEAEVPMTIPSEKIKPAQLLKKNVELA